MHTQAQVESVMVLQGICTFGWQIAEHRLLETKECVSTIVLPNHKVGQNTEAALPHVHYALCWY